MQLLCLSLLCKMVLNVDWNIFSNPPITLIIHGIKTYLYLIFKLRFSMFLSSDQQCLYNQKTLCRAALDVNSTTIKESDKNRVSKQMISPFPNTRLLEYPLIPLKSSSSQNSHSNNSHPTCQFNHTLRLNVEKKKSTFYLEKKWIGRKSGKSKRMKTFSDLTHEMPPCFISFAMLWLRNVKFCVGKIKYDRNPILFWQIQNLTYLSLLNDSTLQLFSETWMWWAVPYQYYSAFFNLNIPEHFQWSKNQYNEMM